MIIIRIQSRIMVLHNYYVEVHKDHKEKTKKKKRKIILPIYISIFSLFYDVFDHGCMHTYIYRGKGKLKNLSLVRQNLLVYCFQIFAPLVQMVSHPREQWIGLWVCKNNSCNILNHRVFLDCLISKILYVKFKLNFINLNTNIVYIA